MVDAGQLLAGGRELPAVDIAPRPEDAQNTVELTGQRVRAAADPALEAAHVLLQAGGPLRRPQVTAEVGTGRHRVLFQFLDEGVHLAVAAPAIGSPSGFGLAVGRRRPRQPLGHLALEHGVAGGVRRRQIDAADGSGPGREVARRHGQVPPVLGQGAQSNLPATAPGRRDHRHPTRRFASGEKQHVSRPDPLEGLRHLRPHRGRAGGGVLHLGLQPPIVLDVAQFAGGFAPRRLEGLQGALELGLEAHDVAVGAVLGEGQVEKVVGDLGRVPAHQVGGHVVGGAERGSECVGPPRSQRCHLVEGHKRRPEDDGIADLVDAPPPGPARQLRVLAGRQELVALPRELGELLHDDGTGGHVDAQCQRLGGEHDFHQAQGEAGLDRLLERRHHPGVMGGHTGFQTRQPAPVTEHGQVGVREGLHLGVDDGADLCAIFLGCETHARVETLASGVVTTLAAEDEVDGREHAFAIQAFDHVHPAGREETAPRAAPEAGRASRRGVQAGGLGIGAPVHERGQQVQVLGLPVSDEIEVVQLDGPALLDDGRGVTPHGLDPVGELLGVRHRR